MKIFTLLHQGGSGELIEEREKEKVRVLSLTSVQSEAVIKLPVVVLLWQRCSAAAKWESPPENIVRHTWNWKGVLSGKGTIYGEGQKCLTLQWNLFPKGLHFFQEGGASGL